MRGRPPEGEPQIAQVEDLERATPDASTGLASNCMVSSDDERLAAKLAQALVNREFGQTRILSSGANLDRDAEDETAVFLFLTLSDPVQAEKTWPHDDVLQLRRAVLDEAGRLGLELNIYIHLAPETDLPQEDDDQLFGT
jgi:hypothetical protein